MTCTFWLTVAEGARLADKGEIESALRSECAFWLDLEIADLPGLESLQHLLPGHHLNWEDASEPNQRPKLEDHGDSLFVVMRGLDTAQRRLAEQLHTVQVACFLTKRGLITVRSGPMASVDLVHERMAKGATLLQTGPDAVLHAVLDDLVDRYGPHVEEWEMEMDRLLREALDRPRQTVMGHILAIRKQMLLLRRLAFGQREILGMLAKHHDGLIQVQTLPYFQDVYDHLAGLVEASETLRDGVGIAVDVYLNSVNNRLNEVMKVLTVISSIILPLSLITGIYGMNFEKMPGLHHPLGFFGVMGFMLLLTIGMIIYFKRSRWL